MIRRARLDCGVARWRKDNVLDFPSCPGETLVGLLMIVSVLILAIGFIEHNLTKKRNAPENTKTTGEWQTTDFNQAATSDRGLLSLIEVRASVN